MSKHERFILTPISTVLRDAVLASSWCTGGVEERPLCEYFIQSVFLKMTGFGEQKLKCILWDVATDDYVFRNEFLHNSYGECSSSSDKNKVLRVLVDKVLPNTDLKKDIIDGLVYESSNLVSSEIKDSVFVSWFPRDYVSFQKQKDLSLEHQILGKQNSNYCLFKKCNDDFSLCDAYERVYRHRNRCAHNLMSYQENLPALSVLRDKKYDKYDNWFIRFWVLEIIDRVFVRLYSRYISLKNMDV